MDYKEKVMALLNSQELSKEQKEKLEDIFPELKESEDERIRKEIISALKNANYKGVYDKHLSWLEKQGEPKHSDKIETKFHEGDWIVFNGLTLYVKEVVKGFYRTITKNGIPNSYDWDIDNLARLWALEDVKDGDVLYAKGSYFKEYIFMFSSFTEDNVISTHFGYDAFHKTFDTKLSRFGRKEDFISITPATKEQHDLLFQKMKKAGYIWNTEKKELSKRVIDEGKAEMNYCFTKMMNGEKVSPAWSEEDERMYRELHNLIYSTPYYDSRKELSDWLKSLKDRILPQPKQEWGEEDEESILEICNYLDRIVREDEDNQATQLCVQELKEWLKSLRPQNTWKPSDEQIGVIEAVINNRSFQRRHLKSLYEQLKKLKGE